MRIVLIYPDFLIFYLPDFLSAGIMSVDYFMCIRGIGLIYKLIVCSL